MKTQQEMFDVLIALLLSILVTCFLLFFNHCLQGWYRDQYIMHHSLDGNEDELSEPSTPEHNGENNGGNNELHVIYTNRTSDDDNRRRQVT